MSFWKKLCVLMFLSVAHSDVKFEDNARLTGGSVCKTKHGGPGLCRLLSDCPQQLHVMNEFQPEYWPNICGFHGLIPYVCCSDEELRPTCASYAKIPTGREIIVALGYLNDDNETYGFDCGGTLISESYVLTAAHCVASAFRNSPDIVLVGVHDLRRQCEGFVVPVENYTIHPLYKPTTRYHDIALLKIKRVQLGNRVLPACLYGDLEIPERMSILGWGSTETDGGPQSPTLQKAELVPVPRSVCNESYVSPQYVSARLQGGITETMVCAKGSNGLADACQGDSGGPLQSSRDGTHLYNVVGVTSFGRLCSGIGVYTRVASYLDWIESIVWPAGLQNNSE